MQKKWWHGKVAYQVYPKSFLDTTGNGIGDLRGIISKLDYLKELGVDIIWLSPCYQSPLADQGYDISDYYQIDPRFGTMNDMDELIAQARKRNLSILMDLVVNHCSDEHEWFQKALQDPYGPYSKYFYFEKGINGQPPNNWRSYFGGSVWEPVSGTDLYYLHLFHKKQPDLNWENSSLREEIYKMMRWWMDKGLAGFRIDAIINIKKALPFSDYSYPPDRDDGLASIDNMLRDAVGVGEFLGEMRDKVFQKYDAFTVGEVFNAKEEELPDFIGDNGYFSTMFDFRAAVWGGSEKGWYASRHITPEIYKSCCFLSQKQMENVGYLSNIIENHDEPRGVSRYIPAEDLCETSKKLLAAVSFMLRGLPWIYQGQEIGMENLSFISIDEFDDVSTLDEYRVAKNHGFNDADALRAVAFYSRDNARTPFQWDDSPNAGFTTGTPWLRVNPNYTEINVKAQQNDKTSLFSFYKELITLRKNPDYAETILYGRLEPFMEKEENLMAFYRYGQNQTLLVLANFQKAPRTLTLPKAYKSVLLNNYKHVTIDSDACVTLDYYQVVILELA
ncbi:MAG: alpha-glucosidase [Lachnospiraceae bacterium]|jgi:oligo-1,6-glucosidase|nr:alpha-glucosidase [Lachnospiraceae bacterium]